MAHYITRIIIITLLLVSKSVVFAGIPDDFSEGGKWEFISNEDGIEVYERWVENETKTKVKERTGRMSLNCSKEEVIELIADATKTHLWMSNVESVNVIEKQSNSEWYIRTVMDAPWPFGRHDMVSQYTISENKQGKKTTIYIKQATHKYPKQEGVDRLDSFIAKWEVVETNKNTVKVSFTTCSTKPPEYPSWMQDPVVRKVFLSNLRNFKRMLGQSQITQG